MALVDGQTGRFCRKRFQFASTSACVDTITYMAPRVSMYGAHGQYTHALDASQRRACALMSEPERRNVF